MTQFSFVVPEEHQDDVFRELEKYNMVESKHYCIFPRGDLIIIKIIKFPYKFERKKICDELLKLQDKYLSIYLI